MQKNVFELAKNAISKSLIIFKIFLKKIFEFLLYHQIFNFKAMLLLMLLLNYCFTKKQNSKKNLIWPITFGNFEIICKLLVEIIAI